MKKILLVDDNFFLQKAIEEKLSVFTDIIIKDTASNGQEAIAILDEVLSDVDKMI